MHDQRMPHRHVFLLKQNATPTSAGHRKRWKCPAWQVGCRAGVADCSIFGGNLLVTEGVDMEHCNGIAVRVSAREVNREHD